MTIDEAIQDFRQLENEFEHYMCDTEDKKENLVKYQREWEYYKQLAEWLEELKELKEKNTEKKVEVLANGEEHCPCCDKNMSSLGFFKHCIDCGQKLDWSDVE